jgi:drug/metabolite transporter (DMT)-like permease
MAIAFYYVCCILFYGFVTILLMGSFYIYLENHLSAVMVGVLYVVGSLFCLFKPKSIKLVFAVSPSKHAVLIEELEQNLAGNISDWRNLSIC